MHQTLGEMIAEQIKRKELEDRHSEVKQDQVIELRWYSEICTVPNPDSWLKNAPKYYNIKTTPVLQYSTDGGRTWLSVEEVIVDYSKKELTS